MKGRVKVQFVFVLKLWSKETNPSVISYSFSNITFISSAKQCIVFWVWLPFIIIRCSCYLVYWERIPENWWHFSGLLFRQKNLCCLIERHWSSIVQGVGWVSLGEYWQQDKNTRMQEYNITRTQEYKNKVGKVSSFKSSNTSVHLKKQTYPS